MCLGEVKFGDHELKVMQIMNQTREISRRSVVVTGAWAVPAISVAVNAPRAAASEPPEPLGSDIVLSFTDVFTGSTTDITTAVITFIQEQLSALGPQVPPAPSRSDFTGPFGAVQYGLALAAWAAQNAEVIAQRAAWDLAVASLTSYLQRLANLGEQIFSVSVTYPQTLTVTNAGPLPLLPGDTVTVEIEVDQSLINLDTPATGNTGVVSTGSTTTLTHVVASTVPAGEVIFTQSLNVNPVGVNLNIQGGTTQSTVTATLAPPSQDTDINDNGDLVTSNVGITLNVLSGSIEDIQDEWDSLLAEAQFIYDLVSWIAPLIDWESVISGLLPFDLPSLP